MPDLPWYAYSSAALLIAGSSALFGWKLRTWFYWNRWPKSPRWRRG